MFEAFLLPLMITAQDLEEAEQAVFVGCARLTAGARTQFHSL